jgi:hypothetical protein
MRSTDAGLRHQGPGRASQSREWSKIKLDFEVPLSKGDVILHEARRIKLGNYVFTTNGATPISGFSNDVYSRCCV